MVGDDCKSWHLGGGGDRIRCLRLPSATQSSRPAYRKPHLNTQNSTEKTATNVPKWKITHLVNKLWKDPATILPCQEVVSHMPPVPTPGRKMGGGKGGRQSSGLPKLGLVLEP